MSPKKKRNGRSNVLRKTTSDSKIHDGSVSESIATSINAPKDKESRKKRPTKTDEISGQSTSDLEEAYKFNQHEIEEVVVKIPRHERIARKTGSRLKTTKEVSAFNHDNTHESAKLQRTKNPNSPKRRGRTRKAISPEILLSSVILESQETEIKSPDGMDEIVERDEIAQNKKSEPRKNHRAAKRQRTSSFSDVESDSCASMKRKIGDISKKYENLRKQYDEVVELGIKEAEKNFDKLKRQNEEIITISNKCLSSLKADLKNQIFLAKEAKSNEKKLSEAGTEIASLKTKLRELENSLAESQAENKTLSAKLAANRTAAVSVESVNSKVPSNTIKANGGIRMMGTVEAALTAQAAQLKEDLYSDLTGLLMRSVTRGTDKDFFDCIQTGRNGTLHFKLAVGNEASAESYDDIQCSYTPLLDPNRDKMLMELLPDYLVDQITFPRPHATKFYARVIKALTEKPI